MGAEERYRYPWKPPYAPGWLLGWPCVRLFDGDGREEEDGRAVWFVEQDEVGRGDGGATDGGGYDGNDNKIPLYFQ